MTGSKTGNIRILNSCCDWDSDAPESLPDMLNLRRLGRYKKFRPDRDAMPKGYRDKQATAQSGAKLEKESELAQGGIADRFKEHGKRPLKEHLVSISLVKAAC